MFSLLQDWWKCVGTRVEFLIDEKRLLGVSVPAGREFLPGIFRIANSHDVGRSAIERERRLTNMAKLDW